MPCAIRRSCSPPTTPWLGSVRAGCRSGRIHSWPGSLPSLAAAQPVPGITAVKGDERRITLAKASVDCQITTTTVGYQLRTPDDNIDAHRFRELVRAVEDELGGGIEQQGALERTKSLAIAQPTTRFAHHAEHKLRSGSLQIPLGGR